MLSIFLCFHAENFCHLKLPWFGTIQDIGYIISSKLYYGLEDKNMSYKKYNFARKEFLWEKLNFQIKICRNTIIKL